MQPAASAMNSIARRKPPKPKNAGGTSGSFDAIPKIEMMPRALDARPTKATTAGSTRVRRITIAAASVKRPAVPAMAAA